MWSLNLLGHPGNKESIGSSPPGSTIRPFPDEEGVFVVERADGPTSLIRQGVVRIGGAVVKYTFEKPVEVKDPIPVVLAPGYGGIKPAYRELRQAIVINGKAAATFRPPRTQERFAGLHPKHLRHPERLLAQSVLAVSQDIVRIDGERDNFQQVDAAGHSMGGPAVTNAALASAKPNQFSSVFRSVTLMASAGLDGHNLLDMAQRAPGVLTREIIPSLRDLRVEKNRRTVRHFAEYVTANPWRTIAEGLAVGSGDIRDKISILGSLGVWTAAQQYAKDGFFPLEGVRENSEDLFDYFHDFPDPEAGHMAPQLQPEAVGEDLIDIIAYLEAQHAQTSLELVSA